MAAAREHRRAGAFGTLQTTRKRDNDMAKQDTGQAAGIIADSRWAAVLARDPAADGSFFYSVRSTGIYCRPSCAARTPLPANVAFHPSAAAAQAAGYRPCLRCKPDQAPLAERHAAVIAGACHFIDAAEKPPSLAQIAAFAQQSPSHLHRLFRQVTGLTPAAYAQAGRHRRLRQALGEGDSVTGALYEAGYGSQGRFYEDADRALGMAPASYRKRGQDAAIRYAVASCSLGAILVAASDRGICAISIGDTPEALIRELHDRFIHASLADGDAAFAQTVATVIAFVEAPGIGLDLPLDLRGTAFQHRVWQALSALPAGCTVTYSELARRIGAPAAVRAVASACAANTLAIAIPCHRVVRSDGTLSGYRWGIERKKRLLALEAAALE